jgi:hypothetical protein
MTVGWREQLRPGVALREIVAQATASLIAMDTERLEELARCCADLNRGSVDVHIAEFHGGDAANADANHADSESWTALEQMAMDLRLLDRVLYETRANLTVLTRLHAVRMREIDLLQTSLKRSANEDALRDLPELEESYGDN